MSNWIDSALGIHPNALMVNARRLELLAENMANADTPNYKARDVDFRSALEGALADQGGAAVLSRTEPGHLSTVGAVGMSRAQYRVPNQPSLDGNTVDGDLEKSAFAEATIRYQSSLDFVSSRISELRKAFRGD